MKTSMMLRVSFVVCLAMALSAQARVNTIKVTTQVDEDGENSSRCSLREAVKAAYTQRAYGGCPAGDDIFDNVVQISDQFLPYQLDDEITIRGDLTIAGAETVREDEVNPMTGQKPRQVRPAIPDSLAVVPVQGSEIKAAPGRRLFNVEGSLTIRDLVLTGNGAVPNNGGLIYSSGTVSIQNSLLRNGSVSGTTLATGNGGAIYLARDGSNLSLTDVTLKDNTAANKGGAIAMACWVDLIPFATHDVQIDRALLQGNSSALGAGVVEFCGNTSATLTASTLSGNSTPTTTSGALAYVQPLLDVSVGNLTLANVTAVEQRGHVLALNGLAGMHIQGSLLGFTTALPPAVVAASLCYPADTAVTELSPTSTLNIFSDDSCSGLYSPAGQNTVLDSTTLLSDLLHPLTVNAGYSLTDFYLPKNTSPYLVDAGDVLDGCTTRDQRNTERRSGTLCDIGSVELMKLTAVKDEGENKVLTDRVAIVDILVNDAFDENVTGPLGFRTNDTLASVAVEVVPDSAVNGSCEWRLNADGTEHPGMLVVTSNGGAITDAKNPVTCQYRLLAQDGITRSAPATVTVHINNVFPRAVDDHYVRPEGSTSITFDPLENDDDDGDGIYGHVGSDPTNPPDWEKFFPIEIMTQPELGTLVGTGPTPSGLCPGSSAEPKTCLAPPLRYIPDNNLSPFADTFAYRVYDQDGANSASAKVTIATDAPEAGEGGSFDLVGIAVLALLGLRRSRKL